MKHAYSVPWAEGPKEANTVFYVVVGSDNDVKVTVRIDVNLHAEGSQPNTIAAPAVEQVQEAVQKWVESLR